jgi:hypothetical protein
LLKCIAVNQLRSVSSQKPAHFAINCSATGGWIKQKKQKGNAFWQTLSRSFLSRMFSVGQIRLIKKYR